MILEESVDGVNFTTHHSAPTTNSTTFVGAVVTANATARYLRISKNSPPSITDFEIEVFQRWNRHKEIINLFPVNEGQGY